MIDITSELEKLNVCSTCKNACEKTGIPSCQVEDKPIIVVVQLSQCPIGEW